MNIKETVISLFTKKPLFVAIFLICISIIICIIPIIVENVQIANLEYNYDCLVPEGVSNQEWLDTAIFQDEGCVDWEYGSDYFERSKWNALHVASIFGDCKAVIYYGNAKVYSDYEQLAPILFRWQCEFDSINDTYYSYINLDYIDRWKQFLRTKLTDGTCEYRIIDELLFDSLFMQTYWDWSGGLRQLLEEQIQEESDTN